MITKEERARDKAICEAAPDGPWTAVEIERAGGWESALRLPSGGHVLGIPSTMLPLIARAREALPAYIADAAEMERQIATLRAFVREIATGYDHEEDAVVLLAIAEETGAVMALDAPITAIGDSLALVVVVFDIERRLGIEIADADLRAAVTVGDLARAAERAMGARQ